MRFSMPREQLQPVSPSKPYAVKRVKDAAWSGLNSLFEVTGHGQGVAFYPRYAPCQGRREVRSEGQDQQD